MARLPCRHSHLRLAQPVEKSARREVIVYAPDAEHDVERLHGWYMSRSARAAEAFMARLALAEHRIELRPGAYRMLSDGETRRYSFRINRTVYLMDYLVEAKQIVVLRVWRGRQERPSSA